MCIISKIVNTNNEGGKMTQKELLYVEDAINHEKNIISILKESINYSSDNTIKDFFNEKLNDHIALKTELLNLLEDLANE